MYSKPAISSPAECQDKNKEMERGKSRRARQRRKVKDVLCLFKCSWRETQHWWSSTLSSLFWPSGISLHWHCPDGKSAQGQPKTPAKLSNVHILQLANDKFKPRHLVFMTKIHLEPKSTLCSKTTDNNWEVSQCKQILSRHLVWHHSTKMYTTYSLVYTSQFFVSRYLSIDIKLSFFPCRCCSNTTG